MNEENNTQNALESMNAAAAGTFADTAFSAEVPSLTLNPEASTQGAAMAVAAQAPVEEKKEAGPVVDESILSPQEKKMVEEFSKQIDLTNTAQILQYGSGTQKKMADFSDKALENVRTKDMGEVGQLLSDVVLELKNFDEDDKKGVFGFFKKQVNKIEVMKTKYDKAEVNINKISDALEQHQVVLMKDSAMLDQMYQQNLAYFKELSMYILAGKKKLEEVRSTTLAELTEKAKASGLPEDAQAARDCEDMCNRFEKKLYDLELTRMISVQTGPQIRLVQENYTLMVEKIQSTLVNTIPLWKNQMVLALGLEDSTKAAKAESEVTDMTNKLLMSNAEKLKQTTIATAKASERGIVDLETLKQTNASLIATLDEVAKIQTEGRSARAAAEQELRNMEDELRRKLLNMQPEKEAPQAPAFTPAVDLNAAPDKAPWEK